MPPAIWISVAKIIIKQGWAVILPLKCPGLECPGTGLGNRPLSTALRRQAIRKFPGLPAIPGAVRLYLGHSTAQLPQLGHLPVKSIDFTIQLGRQGTAGLTGMAEFVKQVPHLGQGEPQVFQLANMRKPLKRSLRVVPIVVG